MQVGLSYANPSEPSPEALALGSQYAAVRAGLQERGVGGASSGELRRACGLSVDFTGVVDELSI